MTGTNCNDRWKSNIPDQGHRSFDMSSKTQNDSNILMSAKNILVTFLKSFTDKFNYHTNVTTKISGFPCVKI